MFSRVMQKKKFLSRNAIQGHSVRQFSDSDEYAVEEFTFTLNVCSEKNNNPMPFGMLPDNFLSWLIMRIEQITFSPPPTSLHRIPQIW